MNLEAARQRQSLLTLNRILLMLFVAVAPCVATAQSSDVQSAVDVQWHTVTSAVIDGKGWTDTEGDFDRFPARAKDGVRAARTS